jgi:hypothetical protein
VHVPGAGCFLAIVRNVDSYDSFRQEMSVALDPGDELEFVASGSNGLSVAVSGYLLDLP